MVYQNTRCLLEQGACALVNCNRPYSLSSIKDLWTLSWMHFNGPTMRAIYEKYIERCGEPCFLAENPENFIKLHQRISSIAEVNSWVRDMELMQEITALLTELMRECWKKALESFNKGSQIRWGAVKAYIDKNYLEEIKLDQLAEKFSVNKYYLLRKFKEFYGVTVTQYIVQQRITKTKELLRFSELSIAEVADKSGYSDITYFTRCLKNSKHDAGGV